jgi:hypothetical protein
MKEVQGMNELLEGIGLVRDEIQNAPAASSKPN